MKVTEDTHAKLVAQAKWGESLDQVSRETQVPAHQLEAWQRRFFEDGQRGLRGSRDPEERELTLAKANIGELTMRLDLATGLTEKSGFADEWKSRKG